MLWLCCYFYPEAELLGHFKVSKGHQESLDGGQYCQYINSVLMYLLDLFSNFLEVLRRIICKCNFNFPMFFRLYRNFIIKMKYLQNMIHETHKLPAIRFHVSWIPTLSLQNRAPIKISIMSNDVYDQFYLSTGYALQSNPLSHATPFNLLNLLASKI